MDSIDYKALDFWWNVGQTIVMAAIGIYVFFASRDKSNAAAVTDLKHTVIKDLDELDTRVIQVEERIKHLPTHEDIGNIHRRVDEIGQALRALEGTLGSVNSSVKLIHQHLLNKRD